MRSPHRIQGDSINGSVREHVDRIREKAGRICDKAGRVCDKAGRVCDDAKDELGKK